VDNLWPNRICTIQDDRKSCQKAKNPQILYSCGLKSNGQDRIRTCEGVSQRIYSPPRLATSVPTRFKELAMPRLSYWLAVSAKRGWIVIDFITIFANGKSLLSVGWLLMKSSTSKPSSTSPKTVYLPSSFGMGVKQT